MRAAFVFLLLLAQQVQAATQQNDAKVEWMEALNSALGLWVFVLFCLVMSLHLLVQQPYMLILLMKEYLRQRMQVTGQVLDCEPKRPTVGSSFLSSWFKDPPKPTKQWLVEVIYKAQGHVHADNPSLKFRQVEAEFCEKSYCRRFVYNRAVAQKEQVTVLLPRGIHQPKSGCPKEVVQRILKEQELKLRSRSGMVVALVGVVLVVLYACVHEILIMSVPRHGWVALGVSLAVMEACSFLYGFDKFMRQKGRTFDACRPMIPKETQQQQQQAVTGRRDL
jgi:hypothetical protein